MDVSAKNLARLRSYDENPWDESEHPRASNGRFTSGSDMSAKLSKLLKDKSTDKRTREAISALGSDIKSALKQAHSEKGFTSGMLQDGKADKLAKKLSELTGEEYYIDTITKKGFMGMNFTKRILKVKE